ncbi:MAG: diacylglycerol kinase family protein [Candidatus Magasanikbacteria bacterium]|nr:diacylglycerol kinase family protein [Candidatus Magasanikbacteria bacterium]
MLQTKNRVQSFKYAGNGLKHAFYTQTNFQIQLTVAFVVLILAVFFKFTRAEWLILIITIGLVLVAELLNTVIEVVVDLAVQEQLLPEAKIAKDVSAAAVLLLSLISVIVGLILFLPHLFTF